MTFAPFLLSITVSRCQATFEIAEIFADEKQYIKQNLLKSRPKYRIMFVSGRPTIPKFIGRPYWPNNFIFKRGPPFVIIISCVDYHYCMLKRNRFNERKQYTQFEVKV